MNPRQAIKMPAFFGVAVLVEAVLAITSVPFIAGTCVLVLLAIVWRVPWSWPWFVAVGSIFLLPNLLTIHDSSSGQDRIALAALIMLSVSLISLIRATRISLQRKGTPGDRRDPYRDGQFPRP